MRLNDIRRLKQLSQDSAVTISLHLLASVVFICFFAVPSIPAVTVYSDGWADASDPNAVNIVGYGMTEANYDDDWELHSVRASTTIRSPSGRSFTRTNSIYYTWNQRAFRVIFDALF